MNQYEALLLDQVKTSLRLVENIWEICIDFRLANYLDVQLLDFSAIPQITNFATSRSDGFTKKWKKRPSVSKSTSQNSQDFIVFDQNPANWPRNSNIRDHSLVVRQ